MNRRMRNRTSGGVGGRREQSRLLPRGISASHCDAGKMRTLKFVFSAGVWHDGVALAEHRPARASLKSPGSARPTSGSVVIMQLRSL